MRRSRDLLVVSTEMPIFVVFSTRGISAGFLGISGSLLVAEGTQRGQESLVPSKIIMATINARKQSNGSTRYTAVVRIRRGTTVLHHESRIGMLDFAGFGKTVEATAEFDDATAVTERVQGVGMHSDRDENLGVRSVPPFSKLQ